MKLIGAKLAFKGMASNQEKKEAEKRVLEAARAAGAPIPHGEILDEEPDFRFISPLLGIEISELSRPASTNYGISPIAEENFQRDVLHVAQEACREKGIDVQVLVHFTPPRGKWRDRRGLISALTNVVVSNHHKANPSWTLAGPALHKDFGQVQIISSTGDWRCGTSGGISVSQISVELASRISAKNDLLPKYRTNLPQGAQVWLLLYSLPSIARSVPIVTAMNEWRFRFEFERVFWFGSCENAVIEIQRANSNDLAEKWMRMEFICECGTECQIDIELIGGPFGSQGFQHCAIGSGRCIPGRIIANKERC